MKARLLKLLLSLCLLPLFTTPTAHAQTASATTPDVQYDVQIENGDLLLAPLKGHADMNAIMAAFNVPTDANGSFPSVPATIGNLAKYLRLWNTNLNLIISPGATDVKISDLKLHTGDMNALLSALYVATDGNVSCRALTGKDIWGIKDEPAANVSHRTVEVFNLSGYINTLGKSDETFIHQRLEEIERLTNETIEGLYEGRLQHPGFRFHPGTSLLIVTGDVDAINVTRKIINALPGQQTHGREDLYEKLDTSPATNQK